MLNNYTTVNSYRSTKFRFLIVRRGSWSSARGSKWSDGNIQFEIAGQVKLVGTEMTNDEDDEGLPA